jgi:hypothetical protein
MMTLKKQNIRQLVQTGILVVFALSVCSVASAQSLWWVENGNEYVRQVSDSTYGHLDSGGTILNYSKIVNNRFWLDINGNSEYKGYCTYSDDKYTYYDRNDNLVATYVPSEKRYYSHSSQGHTILKSEPFAVLFKGFLYLSTGDDSPKRYKVDEGFNPVAIGFLLLVY